jgi:hypothetical protein
MIISKSNIQKLFFLVIFSSLIIACTPDDNATPTPTEPRDNLIGIYSCEEVENGTNTTTFDIIVRKNTTTTDGLLIDNFFNIGSQYTTNATFSNNSINIPQQTVSSFSINGNATFNGSNKLQLTYKVVVGGNISNCTAIATKQ